MFYRRERVVLAYLVLDQHGNIDKHVVELFDATFQPHDVLVTSLNLIQGLLVDFRVHNLRGGKQRQKKGKENES